MTNFIDIPEYKQQIADYFDRRTNYDSESDFHPILAHRLIERAQIQAGQKILDLATGTGLVAIEAAEIVGDRGYVIGVDISPGMLDRAQRKIEAAGLTNIEMKLADVETVEFPENSFDRILCCCAVPYIPNIRPNLRQWRRFLKPEGWIGLTGVSETAYIMGVVLAKVAQNYGVELPNWNEATGTEEKCYRLLEKAGCDRIEVTSEQFGGYISLDYAKNFWNTIMKNPLTGQLRQLDSEELERAKAEYCAEVETLVTNEGIWNDTTVFYVWGRKGMGET